VNYRLISLSLLLTASLAGPAFADWTEIGRLRVPSNGGRFDRDMAMGGPVERLSLSADGDVFCRSVRAEFGNGADRQIFQGVLHRGQPANIDLPGERRTVKNLTFQCRAEHRGDATIRVSADVGQYRNIWQRNPAFSRLWNKAFNWGSEAMNDWQLLGTERFGGRGDTESRFAGWRGRGSDAIALKPLDADARCSRVIAHFGNGGDRALDVNRGDVMQRGRFYKLDLPGNVRNLQSLTLRCRPLGARNVSIQIFTSH